MRVDLLETGRLGLRMG